jgi:hypothetical protein
MNKFIIAVWNSDTYQNRYAAKIDGALTIEEIPQALSPTERDNYINAFSKGLVAASRRLGESVNNLQYEVVELTAYAASADVCEWNRYDFTVYAESEEDAVQLINDEHPTSFHRDDIEWGVESMIGDCDVKNIKIHK